jgi:hypothetical protein
MKALFIAAVSPIVSANINILRPQQLKQKFENNTIQTINANFGYIPYGQSIVSFHFIDSPMSYLVAWPSLLQH